MRSLTLPPEACSHFCPISLSSVCQVDPFGASVPSLLTTSARAGVAAARSNNANKTISFFIGSSLGKQVRDPRHQPTRTSLRQDIDQPMIEVGVDVERQHFLEQRDELLFVL